MNPSPELADLCKRLANAVGLPGPQFKSGRGLDWNRWLDIVENNKLAPFLAQRATADLPQEVRTELERAYAREGRDAFLRASELHRISNAVRAEADFVLLKGAALLGSLYNESAERAMWDVDLLFPDKAALARADAALKTHGFSTGKDLSAHHHAPALKHEFRVLGVELHTNFVTPPLPDELIRALWNRRVMTPDGFYILDPVGQLIHHSIHALNDPLESPLLRNLFEVAWLARRLTPAEQADLKTLTEQWGIAAPVARGLAYAHTLFGSEQILGAPARTLYEFWCDRRLEWTSNLSFAGRVQRHVAHDHIRKMRRGASERNIFPVIGIFWEWFFQSLEKHLRGSSGPLNRVEGHAVNVDDFVIFSAAQTSEVHLLNPKAAQVFNELRGPPAIVRELRRRRILR